jgi:hypothetical protein
LLLFLALAGLLGPFTASSNFSVDLLGEKDTREGTWGYTGAQTWPIQFNPPEGYRVRVLEISGDLIAWPRVLPGETAVQPGAYAGVLVGFQTTAPEGSERCSPCADNTPVYLQAGLDGRPSRIAYARKVNMLLEQDNRLIVKVAAWLNTTGKPIHIEPTFTLKYRWERQSD